MSQEVSRSLSRSSWRPTPSPRWLIPLLLALMGCGRSPQATVRGTVTLDGKPLPAGTVVFEAAGRCYSGAIAAEGRYELRHLGRPEVHPGNYGVAVLPPEPEVVADPKTTNLKAVNPVDPKNYPERYRLPATSGITRNVPEGDSIIDIDLARPE